MALAQQYRHVSKYTLINAQAAGAVLYMLRNPTGKSPIILTKLGLKLVQTTAPTAALLVEISAKVARGYTVGDTTNMTAVTLTGNNAKAKTNYGTAAADLRFTSVAAGGTGGTKALDSDPFLKLALWELLVVPTAGPVPVAEALYNPDVSELEAPIQLAGNEGIVILNDNVLGAAAAGTLFVEIGWQEATVT